MHSLFSVLLPLNFLGICGFWIIWLTHPDAPLTPELLAHIATEFLTGVLCLLAFLHLRRALPGPLFHFALGMLGYASLQATGWAFENAAWPLLILMLLNVIVIAVYFLSHPPIRARYPETRR